MKTSIKQQRGVSLYLSLMIMTMLLSISLGLSAIFLGQTKMIRSMGHSVLAFYAADAGIEKVLIDRGNPNLTPNYYSDSLENEASYEVIVTPNNGTTCVADYFCIKSIGIYKEVRRAIEIVY